MIRRHVPEDSFGRVVQGLRLSVTSRCNANCIYCHKEGQSAAEDCNELSLRAIRRIFLASSRLGISEVKITGGEPTLRTDLADIIKWAKRIVGRVSLTTNGIFFVQKVSELKDAGLDRVNISLDTLDPDLYRQITGGVDAWASVVNSIKKSVALLPTKVNFVLLRGINEHEVWKMLQFCMSVGANLQIIQYESPSNNGKYFKSVSEIEKALARKCRHVVRRNMHARSRYYFRANGHDVFVEVVAPSHDFCMRCTRLRITSRGGIKPCLWLPVVARIDENMAVSEVVEVMKVGLRARRPYF